MFVCRFSQIGADFPSFYYISETGVRELRNSASDGTAKTYQKAIIDLILI